MKAPHVTGARRIRRAVLLAAALLSATALAAPARAAAGPASVPDSVPPAARSGAVTAAAAAPAVTASDFRLKAGTDLSGRVNDLLAALPTQGVQNLMDQANRTATSGSACATDPFGTGDGGIAPLPPAVKWCWDSGDAVGKEWIPQAVTGVSDAQADEYWGTKRPVVVSWYDDNTYCPSAGSNACYEKGVRLSVLDPDTGKYRHVLLAYPFYNSYGHISYQPIDIHAGGMAWYKYRLYVADTLHGLRVFDLRDILDLDPDQNPATDDPTPDGLTSDVQDGSQMGRQNNVWYSYGYRYVLPQTASYDFVAAQSNTSAGTCAASGAPKASYLSIDRSSSPHQLVMGEYCTTDATHTGNGRIGALPIDDTDGSLSADGGVVSPAGVWDLPEKQIQGAARYDGHWYLNQSHRYSDASLWRAAVGTDGTLAVAGSELRTAVGAEDMYVEHGQATGGPQLLWSLTEHRADTEDSSCDAKSATPCGRILYAHRISDILAQP
ncbi:hypothetical protein [Streptomyces sp. HPF1205]|uniref:hypothetical protein n=1 Tax=Streptomyces sp. HPF1205 TaxID=2873262 RepID=UPI001CECEA32|nr:hypothetical protein [Streptomyces sp. HPF1205]